MPSYPWPASGITAAEMRLLFQARQQSQPRVPITRLIAHAIRETFAPANPHNPTPAPAVKEERP